MLMGRSDWLGFSLFLLCYCVVILTFGAVAFSEVRHRAWRAIVWAYFIGQALAPPVLVLLEALSDVAVGRTPRQLELIYGLFFSMAAWPVLLPYWLINDLPCLLGTGTC